MDPENAEYRHGRGIHRAHNRYSGMHGKSKIKTYSINVLDYPSVMSLWERESRLVGSTKVKATPIPAPGRE